MENREKDLSDILSIINDFSYTFTILQKYDERRLAFEWLKDTTEQVLNYSDSLRAIEIFKKNLMEKWEATTLFWQEKTPMALNSILGNVFNVFSWWEPYPSLEEKASNLLYFIIKDHPFNDWNKRIGSFLFILFLKKNNFHLKRNWEKKINDNMLWLLAIMIAESLPENREPFMSLLVNLLKNR